MKEVALIEHFECFMVDLSTCTQEGNAVRDLQKSRQQSLVGTLNWSQTTRGEKYKGLYLSAKFERQAQ